MREVRRLALIQRQALIAKVARRQALRGLAEALEAEARSNALAERASALVASSAPQPGATVGAALAVSRPSPMNPSGNDTREVLRITLSMRLTGRKFDM